MIHRWIFFIIKIDSGILFYSKLPFCRKTFVHLGEWLLLIKWPVLTSRLCRWIWTVITSSNNDWRSNKRRYLKIDDLLKSFDFLFLSLSCPLFNRQLNSSLVFQFRVNPIGLVYWSVPGVHVYLELSLPIALVDFFFKPKFNFQIFKIRTMPILIEHCSMHRMF